MSNFHPVFVPSELPLPLREQALKYAHSKFFSKVGAGDGSAAKPQQTIRYDAVYMKSLRFKDVSTSRPEGLPSLPGITPGVRSASPARQFLDPDKGYRLVPVPPMPSTPFGAPSGTHYPYVRRFLPSESVQSGGQCGLHAECHARDLGRDLARVEDVDLDDNFASPPFNFGVPFQYPFPAFH